MNEEMIKRIIRSEVIENLSFDTESSSECAGDNGDGSMYRDRTRVKVLYRGEEITSFYINQ